MFRKTIPALAALAIAIAIVPLSTGTAAQTPVKTPPAKLDITFRTEPTPPKVGSTRFEVTVKDAAGKAVTNADVSVLFVMPAMPEMKMPEMRKETKLKAAGAGKYTGTGQVMMSGHWNVTVLVKRNGKELGSKKLGVDAR